MESLKLKIVEEALNEKLSQNESQPPDANCFDSHCRHDRPRCLLRCLHSLEMIHHRHALEILVVDNAPPDGPTASVAAQFPGIRYVVEKYNGLHFA